jgi:hypothetical protein
MAVSFTLRLLDRLAAQGERLQGRFIKVICLQILRFFPQNLNQGHQESGSGNNPNLCTAVLIVFSLFQRHHGLDVGVAEEFLDGAGWFSPVPRLLVVRQCIPQASAAGGSAAPRRVDSFEA